MRAFFVSLLLMTGCASVRPVALEEGQVPAHSKARTIDLERRQRIVGYVTRDSVDHSLKGFVERRGDSLQFYRESTGSGIVREIEPVLALPARDVIELRIFRRPPTGPILAIAMVPVMAFLTAYGMTLALW